jgi:prefoldin subunit 5
MISENKTSKYIKYAIGEIILVVIGILIALQINNWNENRKLKIQETAYYCQLIDDVQADISNIDLSIKSLNNAQKASKKLLTNLLKIQEKKDTLFKDYIPAIRAKSFIPTKAAIEDITSSGKLENIRNQFNKNAILNYYVEQDVALEIIDSNREQLWQIIFSYNNHTDFGTNELPQYENLYGEELQNLLVSKEWQKDPNDPLFKNLADHMNLSVIICEREKDLLAGLKSEAEDLITLINASCK